MEDTKVSPGISSTISWSELVEQSEELLELKELSRLSMFWEKTSKSGLRSVLVPTDLQTEMPSVYLSIKAAAEALQCTFGTSEIKIGPYVTNKTAFSANADEKNGKISLLMGSTNNQDKAFMDRGFTCLAEFLNFLSRAPPISKNMNKPRVYLINKLAVQIYARKLGQTKSKINKGLNRVISQEEVKSELACLFSDKKGADMLFPPLEFLANTVVQIYSGIKSNKFRDWVCEASKNIESSFSALVMRQSRKVKDIKTNVIHIHRPHVKDHDELLKPVEKTTIKRFNEKLKKFLETSELHFGNPAERARIVEEVLSELYIASDTANAILKNRKASVSLSISNDDLKGKNPYQKALFWKGKARDFLQGIEQENQYEHLDSFDFAVLLGTYSYPVIYNNWSNDSEIVEDE